MKNIIVALIFLLSAKIALAQKDSLAFDERNKYIYYQATEQPGLSKDTLFNRGAHFMSKAFPKGKFKVTQSDEAKGVLTGEGSFIVPKRSLISNSLGGEISYTMQIEVKDAKYRYWFTDFTFSPYKRDRYGMEVLTPGVTTAMEKGKDVLDKKDFSVYLDKILLNSRQYGNTLKAYMLKVSAKPKVADKSIKKISTKEW
ncbi:DUF4468 domain-containing protein [Mucilaginibacter flavus]|uniref:DUF4468 domain-containing protein n=1 Tax=Mucilaginibacter flavus TaxID=931504 RepID=UPI0025B602F7|nr:DUF4468 domain-containing protein [Mucilaginibacter flavus]MDN3579704.1 DUF4468 domain-containing protein [Mucilaginibacter flavus]